MHRRFFLLYAALLILVLTFPTISLALDPGSAMQRVAGRLSGGIGGAEFGGIAAFLINSIRPLVTVAALAMIVRAGILLVFSQAEDQISSSRRTVIASVIAIILVNVAGPLQEAFLNVYISPEAASGRIGTEMSGLVSWLEVPLGVIAIMMIIISGIRSMLTWGSEEGLTQFRQTVLSVVFGLILLSAKFAISESVSVTLEPSGIIGSVVTVMNIILGLMALIATAVIVYAGFLMILNVGNEEQYTRAKTLIARVGIGLIIILMSLVLANFVILAPTRVVTG